MVLVSQEVLGSVQGVLPTAPRSWTLALSHVPGFHVLEPRPFVGAYIMHPNVRGRDTCRACRQTPFKKPCSSGISSVLLPDVAFFGRGRWWEEILDREGLRTISLEKEVQLTT